MKNSRNIMIDRRSRRPGMRGATAVKAVDIRGLPMEDSVRLVQWNVRANPQRGNQKNAYGLAGASWLRDILVEPMQNDARKIGPRNQRWLAGRHPVAAVGIAALGDK